MKRKERRYSRHARGPVELGVQALLHGVGQEGRGLLQLQRWPQVGPAVPQGHGLAPGLGKVTTGDKLSAVERWQCPHHSEEAAQVLVIKGVGDHVQYSVVGTAVFPPAQVDAGGQGPGQQHQHR